MLTKLRQGDPRWKDEKLGDSPLTIGRFGCTITCLSMGTEYFHSVNRRIGYKLPPALAKSLLFTSGGLLIWSSLASIGLRRENRFYGRQDGVIQEALKNPLKICLLEVNSSHWVLATGKSLLGGYNILDPLYGDSSTTRRYKLITGGCVITIA